MLCYLHLIAILNRKKTSPKIKFSRAEKLQVFLQCVALCCAIAISLSEQIPIQVFQLTTMAGFQKISPRIIILNIEFDALTNSGNLGKSFLNLNHIQVDLESKQKLKVFEQIFGIPATVFQYKKPPCLLQLERKSCFSKIKR